MGRQEQQFDFGFEIEAHSAEAPISPAGCLAERVEGRVGEAIDKPTKPLRSGVEDQLRQQYVGVLVTPHHHGQEVMPNPHKDETFVITGISYKIEAVGTRKIDGTMQNVILIKRQSGPGYRLIPVQLLEKAGDRRWALKHHQSLESFQSQ